MNAVDTKFAHQLLDDFLSNHQASLVASDPSSYASSRQKAFESFRQLVALLGTDLIAERIAAASVARRAFEASSGWGSVAVEAGRKPVEKVHKDMDALTAVKQRRMAAQALMDIDVLLPPGLAQNIATSFWLANLGAPTPITTPPKIKGLKPGAQKKTAIFAAIIYRIYYLSGYRNATLDQVILAEEEKLKGRLSTDKMNKIIQRHGLRAMADDAFQKGVADMLKKIPEDPAVGADYDLERLGSELNI
jgi:hypothetical protein